MKKRFATFLIATAATVFAQDAVTVTAPNAQLVELEVKPALPTVETKIAPKNSSFGYLSMGVSDSQVPKNTDSSLPGLRAGYRFSEGASALDISASYNRRKMNTEEGNVRTYSYTLPNVRYLRYISPARNNSLYAGAGLAWGGIKTVDRAFQGLVPNVALGYEMHRKEALHTFAEFSVSQPAIAASQTGTLLGPQAELTLGAGF